MLIQRVVVGPLRTNCYLVVDEKTRRGVLIDPGAEAELIVSKAKRLRFDPSYILLTHGHADHISAAAEMEKFFPAAKLAIHAADAFMLRDEKRSFGASVGISHPSIEADTLLKDGWQMSIGEDSKLVVIHTPGHSPGGVCFDVRKISGRRYLFSGDTLFKGTIGRTDIDGADRASLVKSIREKLFSLPEGTMVYPGHGWATTIGEERNMGVI